MQGCMVIWNAISPSNRGHINLERGNRGESKPETPILQSTGLRFSQHMLGERWVHISCMGHIKIRSSVSRFYRHGPEGGDYSSCTRSRRPWMAYSSHLFPLSSELHTHAQYRYKTPHVKILKFEVARIHGPQNFDAQGTRLMKRLVSKSRIRTAACAMSVFVQENGQHIMYALCI